MPDEMGTGDTEPLEGEKTPEEQKAESAASGKVVKAAITTAVIGVVLLGNGIEDKIVQDKAIGEYIAKQDSIQIYEESNAKVSGISKEMVPVYSYFDKDDTLIIQDSIHISRQKDPEAKPECRDSLDEKDNPVKYPDHIDRFGNMIKGEVIQVCIDPVMIEYDSVFSYEKIVKVGDSTVVGEKLTDPYERYSFPDIFDKRGPIF